MIVTLYTADRDVAWVWLAILLCMSCFVMVTGSPIASFPGAIGNWGEERLVSTVRACAAPQVFVGNLETTVILVRVARPYITETRETFTSTRRSSIQPSRAIRPQ